MVPKNQDGCLSKAGTFPTERVGTGASLFTIANCGHWMTPGLVGEAKSEYRRSSSEWEEQRGSHM